MNFSRTKIKLQNKSSHTNKKSLFFLFVYFSLHVTLFAQVLEGIDRITPFHEDLAAIKKGNTWAFVDQQGVMVIDFREDLVTTKTDDGRYPRFVEGKCLIKKRVDGEDLYGFIDKKGVTVIEPEYLNATNFTNGFALVIKLDESKMGTNTALGKKMVNLKLEEYVIDASGKIIKFLDNSRGYQPANTDSKKAPKFKSKFIAPNLAAVNNNGKWDIYKF